MRNVYVYDHHDGWEDLMFVTDHELSDIDRFCWYCEEWDPKQRLIRRINCRLQISNAIPSIKVANIM